MRIWPDFIVSFDSMGNAVPFVQSDWDVRFSKDHRFIECYNKRNNITHSYDMLTEQIFIIEAGARYKINYASNFGKLLLSRFAGNESTSDKAFTKSMFLDLRLTGVDRTKLLRFILIMPDFSRIGMESTVADLSKISDDCKIVPYNDDVGHSYRMIDDAIAEVADLVDDNLKGLHEIDDGIHESQESIKMLTERLQNAALLSERKSLRLEISDQEAIVRTLQNTGKFARYAHSIKIPANKIRDWCRPEKKIEDISELGAFARLGIAWSVTHLVGTFLFIILFSLFFVIVMGKK